MEMGGEAFSKIGKPNNTGTRIWCVSGQVKNPGYFEFECGALTLGEMIYDVCGGLLPGRTLQAVIPGGSSAKILRADESLKALTKMALNLTGELKIYHWILMVQWLQAPCQVPVG